MTGKNWKSQLRNIQNASLLAWARAAASFQDLWRRSQLSDDWSGTQETLLIYWTVYGGWRALYRSPAFLFSVVASVICFPVWWGNASAALGFSIGAMAVVLAFPTTTVFEIITEEGRDDSYYLDLVAKFAHFVFVQVSGLVCALVATAIPFFLFSYLTLLALFYAVGTAAMTAIALFEVAVFYNKSQAPKE